MQLLLDLGNSRLKMARWSATLGVVDTVAIDHRQPNYVKQMQLWLDQYAGSIDNAKLACVADKARADQLISNLTARHITVQHIHVIKSGYGIEIAYAKPERLGVDRYLGMLGARARGLHAWLIVSAGSAITVDMIDANGRHHGGLIAPSVSHMQSALAQRFPVLDLPGNDTVIFATDTGDAVAAGCLQAVVGLIDQAQRNACALLGHDIPMLITGGDSEKIHAGLSEPFKAKAQIAAQLVLEGIAIWASQQVLDSSQISSD